MSLFPLTSKTRDLHFVQKLCKFKANTRQWKAACDKMIYNLCIMYALINESFCHVFVCNFRSLKENAVCIRFRCFIKFKPTYVDDIVPYIQTLTFSQTTGTYHYYICSWLQLLFALTKIVLLCVPEWNNYYTVKFILTNF